MGRLPFVPIACGDCSVSESLKSAFVTLSVFRSSISARGGYLLVAELRAHESDLVTLDLQAVGREGVA